MPQSATNHAPLIAAIDLGSNSFHMLLAKNHQAEVRVLERIGEKVQLAAGLDDALLLQEDAIERGLDCLRRFAQLISDLPRSSVRVVGTSTLRIAHNRQEFIDRAEKILGHHVEVISGREEARLIYLGVSHSLPSTANKRLALDIGGGSTECIIGQHFESQYRSSLQMGCIRFTQRFFRNHEISPSHYDQAYTAARLELLSIEQTLKRLGWDEAVGASGTIKSIAQACCAAGFGEGEINQAGIAHLKQQLFKLTHINQVNIAGVKPQRASIFPAGLAIVEAIFDALGLAQLHPANGALREGVLYDLLGRHQHEDVRERSINALLQRCHVDLEQAARVETQALKLLEQLATVWQLTENSHHDLLGWAARVHEVGLDIAHYQYHKHGAYLIEHCDLAGFSRQDQQRMALLVRGHRQAIPLQLFQQSAGDTHALIYLCVILRIAILLCRMRGSQTVPQLQLRASPNALEVLFPAGWLADNPLTAADFNDEAHCLARIDFKLSYGESIC